MLLQLTISGSETNSTVKMALLPLILASSTSTTGAASGYACVEWKKGHASVTTQCATPGDSVMHSGLPGWVFAVSRLAHSPR